MSSFDLARARTEYNEFYRSRDFRQIPWAERGMITAIMSRVSVPKGSTVFDIGCGTGKYAHMIAGLDHVVVGVDLSEVGVRRARDRGKAAYFVVGDATRLPLRPESADVVFSSGLSLFNEVDLTQVADLVEGMVDLVKVGGYFAFVKTSMLTGRLSPRGSRFDHTLESIVEMVERDPRLTVVLKTFAVPHFFALRGLAFTGAIRAASSLAARLRIPSRICVIVQRTK